ncbi:hypothetical protein Y695_04858 [Hydrogenophaga sp. T4]|nr:hypothetical protein Y695_04858 [Hydrogenophaga sp. T4]
MKSLSRRSVLKPNSAFTADCENDQWWLVMRIWSPVIGLAMAIATASGVPWPRSFR